MGGLAYPHVEIFLLPALQEDTVVAVLEVTNFVQHHEIVCIKRHGIEDDVTFLQGRKRSYFWCQISRLSWSGEEDPYKRSNMVSVFSLALIESVA